MKRLVPIGMFCVLLAGCGNADIETARSAVKQQLNDPSSAEFRNEKVYHDVRGLVVCGEVNAKNRFGGYTGYKPYVVDALNSVPSANLSAESEMDIKITCQLAEQNDRIKRQ